MTERNCFRKITANDYEPFLRYYTQIEYSYFKDGDESPNQEEETRLRTIMAEMVHPRNVSFDQFLKLIKQGDFYLYYNQDGEILGIVVISSSSSRKVLTIHDFFVLKKYQRQHIGSKMYSDFLYFLKEEGYFRVRIDLMCSFEGAEEFWKHMGYKLVREEPLKREPKMRYKSVSKDPPKEEPKMRYYSKTERPNRLP